MLSHSSAPPFAFGGGDVQALRADGPVAENLFIGRGAPAWGRGGSAAEVPYADRNKS